MIQYFVRKLILRYQQGRLPKTIDERSFIQFIRHLDVFDPSDIVPIVFSKRAKKIAIRIHYPPLELLELLDKVIMAIHEGKEIYFVGVHVNTHTTTLDNWLTTKHNYPILPHVFIQSIEKKTSTLFRELTKCKDQLSRDYYYRKLALVFEDLTTIMRVYVNSTY